MTPEQIKAKLEEVLAVNNEVLDNVRATQSEDFMLCLVILANTYTAAAAILLATQENRSPDIDEALGMMEYNARMVIERLGQLPRIDELHKLAQSLVSRQIIRVPK